MSASTASMPFLSIRRTAALETRRRTKRFSLSTQKRRYCRFGRNRRLVLLLAWETLFPTIGPLPVTSQTRAIGTLLEPPGHVTVNAGVYSVDWAHLALTGAVTGWNPAKPAIIAGWGETRSAP